jgi:imidazolonepropionase-like amidohydrolase
VSIDVRITADFLIDGSGAPPLANPEIHIEDGTFSFVGQRRAEEPTGVKDSLDFPGCTVIPGLIDSHVHLAMSPHIDANQVALDLVRTPEDVLVLRAERHARLALGAGITTLRDCGGPGKVTMALRDAIGAGLMIGPRLMVCGRPITTTAGHCHFMGERADSATEIRKVTRALCREGVDFIKIMATGGMLTPGSNPAAVQFSTGELAACVEEAHRLGRRVAAHVLCSAGVRAAVAAGVDTIEHCWSISGASQDADDETIGVLADSELFGSVTAHRALRKLLCDGAEGVKELRRRLGPHRAMRQAGVPLPVHSDAGTPGTRFESFYLSVDAFRRGLETSVEEAIRAATHVPAMALGLGDRLGKIESGYESDLVVVRCDPRRSDFSISKTRLVMLRGKVIAENGLISLAHHIACERR